MKNLKYLTSFIAIHLLKLSVICNMILWLKAQHCQNVLIYIGHILLLIINEDKKRESFSYIFMTFVKIKTM